ncbi:MAG TPA: glycine betaine ABC transporter substrate-binding protein [Polyangiaceae bacterium]
MKWGALALLFVALVACANGGGGAAREHVVVGSKAFPESWVLGESAAMLARTAGAEADHRRNLGATEITYAALRSGAIDVYPEYTGTIREVLLHGAGGAGLESLRDELARNGIGMSDPLGFDNSYALATTAADEQSLGLRSISDLRRLPDLRLGFNHEFLGRADGWPGLVSRYGLASRDVRGVQHEMALDALAHGQLDVTDVYTTDAQIDRLGLKLLDDDLGFFPRYQAVLLFRADLPERAPGAYAAIMRLAGHVDATTMRRANAALVLDGRSVQDAARGLLGDALGRDVLVGPTESPAGEIARNTWKHVQLVLFALLASIAVGVPLGIAAARSPVLGAIVTSAAGVVQTVPSLALLALLVPLLGIGAKPALTALVLYGLLPIVRGTQTGLTTIPTSISESAAAIGLPPRARLFRVFLPIASPHVLAGIRTSAVIAVGTATLAALVGAEGLGGPILQGIALRDPAGVLSGAVPAALLALAVDGAFALASRALIPVGLRPSHGRQQVA